MTKIHPKLHHRISSLIDDVQSRHDEKTRKIINKGKNKMAEFKYFSIIDDLKTFIFPQVAKLLGTTIDNVLAIDNSNADWSIYSPFFDIEPDCHPNKFLNLISSNSPYKDFPRIQLEGESFGKESKIYPMRSYLNLYETKSTTPIKFVSFCSPWGSPHITSLKFTFFKKGEYWKIIKFMRNNVKKSINLQNKPILDDDFINEILDNSIHFLKYRKEAKKFGVSMNRGILFTGEPGNGKTMLTRYIRDLAKYHNLTCSIVTTSDINASFSKESLEDMLYDPSDIVIFDDINIEYLSRSGSGSDVACSFLSALDGVKKSNNISVRIFSTNEEIKDIDPAFLRPGRIDKVFTFKKPNKNLREKFISNFHRDILSNIDLQDLLDKTDDFSFAQLESVKTNLVSNFLMKNSWNLDKALESVVGNNSSKKKQSRVGFI